MSVRIYVGPMEEVTPTHWRSVASQYMTGGSLNFVPSAANGLPASAWVITIGRAASWTTADLDARITNMFGPELDGTEDTKADILAALQGKTLAQVGGVRATAIKARLDLMGVAYEDFTGSTTMLRLFRRVLATLMSREARHAELRDSDWVDMGWSV